MVTTEANPRWYSAQVVETLLCVWLIKCELRAASCELRMANFELRIVNFTTSNVLEMYDVQNGFACLKYDVRYKSPVLLRFSLISNTSC
jgi:hypothetical protein